MLRRKASAYRAGDVVVQDSGQVSIVTGSGHKGYSVTLLDEEKYLPASKCRLLWKNTGIVGVKSTVRRPQLEP